MSLTFDKNGVITNTFSEIFDALVTQYEEIYGTDIDTDQESPDGQKIGLESVLKFDTESMLSWLYSQLDPDLNNGDMQQVIAKLAGVYLLAASRSQWDLVVNVSRDLTLPGDYTIADDNGTEWFLDYDVDLFAGDNNVTFLASLWGDTAGIAGAEFTQSTPELYVNSITANDSAVQGREEETEEEFRIRRKSSVENTAQSTNGSIYAKLAATSGVIDLAVYDNGTNTDNVLTGSSNQELIGGLEAIALDAHTKWVVVEGGSLDDIGEILAKNHLGGIKGDTVVTYSDTLTRPDGTQIIVVNENKIDRPDYIDLHIKLTATLIKPLEFIDSDSIKASLSAYVFYIGNYIQAGELYDSAYITNYNYVVSGLKISFDGVTWTDGRLFSGFKGKFKIDTANITITEA